MIYISVDNDYHTSLALSLVAQYHLPQPEVTFISHISKRNTTVGTSGFSFHSVEVHPLCAGNSYRNPLSYIKSIVHQIKIRELFNFNPKDILILTTEYELNNSIFAKQMRQAGGKTYILDEGVGFYFNNSPYHDLHIKSSDKFYLALYNFAFEVLGIPAYAKKGQEGRMFACILDSLVDAIFSSLNLPINRKIKINGYQSRLKSSANPKAIDSGIAMLFAANFECFNSKEEEMHLAALAIEKMAMEFTEVYIKVHPSDYHLKNDVFEFYKSLQGKNVKLVDNHLTAIDAINIYRPAIVVGTMSAALFDAMLLGCQPIFLFHLLPPITEFGVYKFTLDKLNYQLISSVSDISAKYQCKVDVATLLHESSDANFLELH
jgi:hypothetical protein